MFYVSACDHNISLKFVLPSTSKRTNFLKRKWKLLLFIGCSSRKTKLFFWFGNVEGESEMNNEYDHPGMGLIWYRYLDTNYKSQKAEFFSNRVVY